MYNRKAVYYKRKAVYYKVLLRMSAGFAGMRRRRRGNCCQTFSRVTFEHNSNRARICTLYKDAIERTFEHACPQHVQRCRGATGVGLRVQNMIMLIYMLIHMFRV